MDAMQKSQCFAYHYPDLSIISIMKENQEIGLTQKEELWSKMLYKLVEKYAEESKTDLAMQNADTSVWTKEK